MRAQKKDQKIWLVTTDHLSDRIWFRDDEDFKVGMNLVALIKCLLDIDIYAFILMSNHVHFVLCSTREQAKQFINELKKRYSQHMNRKYGTKDWLRRNGFTIQLIDGKDESFERAVAYVQMNSVAARICLNASDYLWGTGCAFFRGASRKGRKIGTMSSRARERLMHSRLAASDALVVGEEGYIFPESYVDVSFVEAVFRTPGRMNYFLQNSSKAKKRQASADDALPAFRDQVIQAAIPDLCRSLFQKMSFPELNESEAAELLRQLRFRFSAQVNQLARVSGLSYEKAVRLLDQV